MRTIASLVPALLLLALRWQPETADAAPVSKSTATHDGLRRLTEANWTMTQQGAWLIEFYSPFCSHCKAFMPVWSELSTAKDSLRSNYPGAPFTMAQVDCIAQQDVCMREGVTFFPKLSVYRDGVENPSEAQYHGAREYTELSKYIDEQASLYRHAKGVSDEPVASAISSPVAKLPAVVASPVAASGVDNVAQLAVLPLSTNVTTTPPEQGPVGPNPEGKLIKYGDKELPGLRELERWLGKGAGVGPVFVKFFAPWCPHCKALVPAWLELARSLKGQVNVIEVDCEANRGICQKYGIQGFPTLRMYNDGVATEYRGGRSLDALQKWAVKAGSAAGVREIAADELTRIAKSDDVFFLYLHSPGTPAREAAAVETASKVLIGTPVKVYRSSDPVLLERYHSKLATGSVSGSAAASSSTSGLLVFKDHKPERPTSAFYPSTLSTTLSAERAAADVGNWLTRERYPTVSEVTGATSTDILYNKQHALVVLAALSDEHHGGTAVPIGTGAQERDMELKTLRALALQWRNAPRSAVKEDILFAWLDADRFASFIKKNYNLQPQDLPRLVLVDGARLEYYNLPSDSVAAAQGSQWLDAKAVFDTIEAVSQGQVKPKSSRSYIDRGVQGANHALDAIIIYTSSHPLFSFSFLLSLFFGLFFYIRRSARASQPALSGPFVKAD